MKDLARFLRFEYLAFALMLTQIGAASAAASVPVEAIVGLLAASTAFHVYISLLNDLIDLPLDRTNPGRRNYPLVKGTIRPWQAWLVTLAMLPLLVGLTLRLGGGAVSFTAMAVTLAMMTIYDVWGKRTRAPLVIDLVQGIGFAALVLFGAGAVGPVSPSTWLLFLWVVVWMMLANFLGGLRDLKEDHRFGAFTTPMQLGVTLDGAGFGFTRRAPRYACALQLVMTALALAVVALNGPGHGTLALLAVAAVVATLGLAAVALLVALFTAARRDLRAMKRLGSLQLSVSLTVVLVQFFACAHGWLFASMCAALYGPSLRSLLPRRRAT